MSSATATSADLLPPANFNSLTVPHQIFNLGATDLFRVHRKTHGPIFYNRRPASSVVFRWDSASHSFGVLYAAPEFATCMAETVIRGKFQGAYANKVVYEKDIEERMLSRIGCAASPVLKLADLTRDLFAIGADATICSSDTNNYAASNAWSDALFGHPSNFDGIYYPSRYTGRPAVAIFDRVVMHQRGSAVPLTESPELGPFLDQYNIALLPDVGSAWV